MSGERKTATKRSRKKTVAEAPEAAENQIVLTEEEMERLKGYPSEIELRDPNRYDFLPKDMATMFLLKDQTIGLFERRFNAAKEVIDLAARRVGIDPGNTGFWLYSLDPNGSSPIVAKMDEYFDRGGDKLKLKKRVDELEKETIYLRSIIAEITQTQ